MAPYPTGINPFNFPAAGLLSTKDSRMPPNRLLTVQNDTFS